MNQITNDDFLDQTIDSRITDRTAIVDIEYSTHLLKELVQVTHEADNFRRDCYIRVITDICNTYHISKGVSEFYQTVLHEKRGEGETYCDIDNGKGEILLLRNRILSTSGAVIISTLYVSKEAPVLSLEDIRNLDLMLRVIMGFISRRRLQMTVEKFVFFDDFGYRNTRFYFRKIAQLAESGKLPGMIAIHIDLHNFAVVNMDLGRETGDIVMRNYYNILEKAIGNDGCIARLGGDKFVAVFSSEKKKEILGMLAGVSVPYDSDNEKHVMISAAAGIYEVPKEQLESDRIDVMEKIMMASNIAKRHGEGAIIYYDASMKSAVEHAKNVRQKFRKALNDKEFLVYYQPKVDVNTGRLMGAEALCRWISNGKLVIPGEFIPILEQSTDICDLDFYVLDHVCKDIRRRLDEDGKGIRTSVNLSRKHLINADLLEQIIKIVDSNNVPHEYIEIELTETTTDVQFRDLKRVVLGLREVGINTTVDDFGIGYSSMNLIRDIPWDVLKIDRSFLPMDESDDSSTTKTMFKHLVSMSLDMGLECVVEGVETQAHVDILRENNCHIAQGYYFDKPLPIEEFRLRLNDPDYYKNKIKP